MIVFAHYGKGYDSQFVYREIIKQRYKPEVVSQGLKIFNIKIGNVRFLDSINFLLLSLKSLPETFKFENLVEKGEFPHNFSTEENLNYSGTLPPIEAYGTDNMLPKAARKIMQWHSENKNTDFNFINEMISYCKKDVHVLMLAIMTFKNLIQSITSLNPFVRTFTLASAGMECIRTSFLKDKFLHQTPNPPEYFNNKRASKIASVWLDLLEKDKREKLIREYRIGDFFVFSADPTNKIAYEFLGCYWHSCPCQGATHDPQKYSSCLSRLSKIRSIGWKLEVMKECEFRKHQKETLFFKQRMEYWGKMKRYDGCNLSEAFYGGRCTNLSFFRKCEQNEVIEYFDVVSEYPYCLKYRPLPFGIPQEISTNLDYTLESYGNLGFAKVSILPPQNLRLPVLPARINGKQIYTLCRKCAELEQQTECSHEIEDRCLTSTYTLCELKEALKRNYKIIWMTQVLVYEDTGIINPYRDYVDLFLKIKQEASGWPDWVKTEEDQDKYIDDFFERENVKLDKQNIKFNAGLRFIAKIFLNSSWGKLAQRKNMASKEVCFTTDDYFKILNDESKEILSEVEINSALEVTWKSKELDDARSVNTNIGVAAHVTSWARLHLYKFMCMVEERYGEDNLLYMDTDSLIYVRKDTEDPLPTGSYLGDLTDEYPGCKIQKFTSTGSKSYGLEYLDREGNSKSLIKVKGIKLTVAALEHINLENIINAAIEYTKGNVIQLQVPQFEIRPTSKHEMYSRYFLKNFKPTSTKRIINSGKTLPYGFTGSSL